MYKLRQLMGKRAEKGEIVTVAQEIDEVLIENKAKANGWERLGFLDRRDNAHINFKAGLSDEAKQDCHTAVTKMRAEQYKFATAGKFASTPVLPKEVTDGEPAKAGGK